MKVTLAQTDLDGLTLTDRMKTIYRFMEKGRKKGTSLVLMSPFNDFDELLELVEGKNRFLTGTQDYPDIFLLLTAKSKGQLLAKLILEGEVVNEAFVTEGSKRLHYVRNIYGWEVFLNMSYSVPDIKIPNKSLICHFNLEKYCFKELNSMCGASFLINHVQDRSGSSFFHKGSYFELERECEKTETFCLGKVQTTYGVF
ncbi:MAG TPA: hypothetical protein GX522_03890 [Firmicutes bacterium]|nr:hypothetical protein [Bacillota bacterium]